MNGEIDTPVNETKETAPPQTEILTEVDKGVSVPVPPVNDGTTVDDSAEIAEAEKEYNELLAIKAEYEKLKATQAPQGGFDPQVFGQTLAQHLAPLMPKPPSAPKLYEQEDWTSKDVKHFRAGLDELLNDRLSKFEEEKIKNVLADLGIIKQTLPKLYMRAAENPQYPQIAQRTQELMAKYQIEEWKASQMAYDELKNQVAAQAKTVPNVPKHMSAPDNRASTIPNVSDSGPATFADIIRDIRAKHGNNI